MFGMRRLHQRGEHWPLRNALGFFGLGLGSYAVIELGFLGVESADLRWAFTTRIALLIFVVPACVAAGRPIELWQRAAGEQTANRISAVLRSRLIGVFGNAMFATVFIAAVFCLFLTPIAWVLRGTPWLNAAVGIVVPLVGMVMVLPLMALGALHTGLFITIEFLLAFVELVIDSIPGILLRLNESVLDHAPVITGTASWWPNPLHDQHLAGDFLWFIAEVADVPVLVFLMIRWMRSDRREAKTFDDLDDDEYEAMTQAHLRGER
ncbi:MAG: cytochrome c oxidase assembly protein [Actinobacteria bacterium]|nr:cytochrome c oxidase assembly protein [Actinomycetota bacterium]